MNENTLESVKNQNITNNSFFIQKAGIELITKNGKEKFIGNIKFEYPDKYLISIKNRTGIEGARIYISKDSILVNDRINKNLYYGNSMYLLRKYGLDQSFLPLIFGDIILDRNYEHSQEKCSGEKMNINCVVKGVMLNYSIDCKKKKSILVNQVNNFVQQGIQIKYEGFLNVGEFFVPKTIEFDDPQYNTVIRIKILKVEFPWSGNVKFIPGKGYELIELV